jgi:hypothetical protein
MGFCIFILSRERKKNVRVEESGQQGASGTPCPGMHRFCLVSFLFLICFGGVIAASVNKRIWFGRLGTRLLVCTIGWIGGLDEKGSSIWEEMIRAGLARSVVL